MTIAIFDAVSPLLIVGVFAGRTAKGDDEDSFFGGRTLGAWVAVLSAGGSAGGSAWVSMGLVGLAIADGLQASWISPGAVLGEAFIWFVLASRMRSRSPEPGAVTFAFALAMVVNVNVLMATFRRSGDRGLRVRTP